MSIPGHVRLARCHVACDLMTLGQKGHVRHCAGRSSYTPHTALPGMVVRSRKTQSRTFPFSGSVISRSVSDRPSLVMWV